MESIINTDNIEASKPSDASKSITSLQDAVNRFIALEEMYSEPVTNYNLMIRGIFDLCCAVIACESTGCTAQDIRSIIQPARELHRYSPFVKRLQDWPRGYPGDFETIEYIMNGINKAPINTLGFYCERTALNSSLAQQHRNKVQRQANSMLEAVHNYPDAKVLSIACGSCPDLAIAQHYINNRDAKFLLNDIDQDALAFSRARLTIVADQCQFIPKDALTCVRSLGAAHDFALVVAGGLFDYLDKRQVVFLIKSIYHRLLRPGGRLLFTNIAEGNPHRAWMEYLVSWHLIERSEQDIRNLCSDADVPESSIVIVRDVTDLTYLVELRKDGPE